MKVLLKSFIKYIAIISFLVALTNMSFGQNRKVSQRLLDAEDELYELIQIDKGSLSKSEAKIWKKQKRHLERIISDEKNKANFYAYNRNSYRYNSSYYSPYVRRSGYYSRRYTRYPRRVIVVRR